MGLVTYVVTVETSQLKNIAKRIKGVIEHYTDGKIVESKWAPDNDTISEAYGEPEHVTVVLND